MRKFAAQAAAAGESIWPGEFRVNGGAVLQAEIVEPRVESLPVDGGDFVAPAVLVVRVRKTVLAIAPARKAVVEWRRIGETAWRPEKWVVESVEGSPADVRWCVRCEVRN